MKAIVQSRYGSVDTLAYTDVDPPAVGAHQVQVKVHAAGVDRGTWHLMQGLPYLVRLAGFGVRAPKAPVPGLDLAGVVTRVGSAVQHLRVGDEVFGVGRGSFAELTVADEHLVVTRPADVPLSELAISVSAVAALQAVRDHARLEAGQQVLVLGASGGVGSFAVQLARASGATVTGVCSGSKADLVRDLGAEHVIDYSRHDLGRLPERFDAIIDIGGNRRLVTLRRCLKPTGRLVIVGGEGGGRLIGGTGRLLRAQLLSPFVSQSLGSFISQVNRPDLLRLRELLEAGQVRPVIDRTFALSEAAKAIQYLTEGHARGKIAVSPLDLDR